MAESQAVHDEIPDITAVASEIACPKCGSSKVHRVEREGFLENRIYNFFGYYPWNCHDCRRKFLFKKRYRSKRHGRSRNEYRNRNSS